MTGDSDPTTPPEIGVSVHVDDVSWLHVLALDQNKVAKSKPVQNFFISKGRLSNPVCHFQRRIEPLTYTDITWDDVPKIAAEKFPEAIASGKFSATGTKKSKAGVSNAGKSEAVLGRKLKSLEDMVVDLTNQYLELLGKA